MHAHIGINFLLSKFLRGEMFLQSLVNLVIVFWFGLSPPNLGEDQKKVFAAFWFYLSSEFRISGWQVGITCQKTEVPDILRPLQCQILEGSALKIDTYACTHCISSISIQRSYFTIFGLSS